jgi:hypothetical protein
MLDTRIKLKQPNVMSTESDYVVTIYCLLAHAYAKIKSIASGFLPQFVFIF